MPTTVRIVAGILLLAHGLVHLLYLVPEADDPEYPFTLEASWMVPDSVRRPVALILIAATVVAFALLALAVWGVPGLSTPWPVLTFVASGFSLLLLIAFWDVRLGFGVLIDVVLIAVAGMRPGWIDQIGG